MPGKRRAVAKRRILCLSGPNLQLLGTREPAIYGRETLEDVHARVAVRARELGAEVVCHQSNHEGELVERIGAAKKDGFDAILLNAAAYTHTSVALLDAIKAVALPCVEVHLSNPEAREPFRRRSLTARACVAKVAGFGADSYVLALEGVLRWLERR
jgi:3-dehydroquinate dehydratase-2